MSSESNSTTTPQIIPDDFKTTLPPRKRAKTQEEKEQRRIQRIMRNRRAARKSRERKRLHMESMEMKLKLYDEIFNSLNIKEQLYNSNQLNLLEKLNSCHVSMDEVDDESGEELSNAKASTASPTSLASTSNTLVDLTTTNTTKTNDIQNNNIEDFFSKIEFPPQDNKDISNNNNNLFEFDNSRTETDVSDSSNLQMQWFEPMNTPESTVSFEMFNSPIDWELMRNPAVNKITITCLINFIICIPLFFF